MKSLKEHLIKQHVKKTDNIRLPYTYKDILIDISNVEARDSDYTKRKHEWDSLDDKQKTNFINQTCKFIDNLQSYNNLITNISFISTEKYIDIHTGNDGIGANFMITDENTNWGRYKGKLLILNASYEIYTKSNLYRPCSISEFIKSIK